MHSHDYRVPEIFTGKRVLVVGAGPSGMDIAIEITRVTAKVILSHHLKEEPKSTFPDNLVLKPDVMTLEGRKATFADGTEDEVDVVFLSTGECYNIIIKILFNLGRYFLLSALRNLLKYNILKIIYYLFLFIFIIINKI